MIVTELVINAVKHAFPTSKIGASIKVGYETSGADWKWTVAGNGVGKHDGGPSGGGGLETAIVPLLVKQLNAVIEITRDTDGVRISVTKASVVSCVNRAA